MTVEPERNRSAGATRAPHPNLSSLIARDYAGFRSDRGQHLVLPASVSVPLIVKLEDSPVRPPEFAMGVRDAYFAVDGACAPAYLNVWLAPLGAYTLLGLPIDRIAGQTVDLVDLLGPEAHRLADQVRDAPSWHARFTLIDQFLLRRREQGPRPAPEVAWAWHRLVETAGAAPIGGIAREVGWSHRHLIARFRREIGLAPKAAARLVRFDGVWRYVDERASSPASGRSWSWSRVAAEAGYADQAHLIRDFRRFTGTTPTRFPVNSVQGTNPVDA
jgi:AraC-like DNA-binding protein